MENKITRSLTIEKEGDQFVSVLKKAYDYEDYYTTKEDRMTVKTKKFLIDNIKSIEETTAKKELEIGNNDNYLNKIEKEFKPHWDSKTFSGFMKNYDKKYSKLIEWKKKYDEFMNKSAQNDQWKAEMKVELEFKTHFEEMLSKWEK